MANEPTVKHCFDEIASRNTRKSLENRSLSIFWTIKFEQLSEKELKSRKSLK